MESKIKTDMKLFVLERFVDDTGISGTGIVAEGVVFSDGSAVLRWIGHLPTSVVFHDKGIYSIERIHGHSGHTRVKFLE